MSKYIGNIVQTGKRNVFGEHFNVVSDIQNTESGIPTLIIGFENAKRSIEGFSILKNSYGGDMFWVFSKTENRSEYEKGVNEFKKYTLLKLLRSVKYQYVNFTCYPLNRIKKFISYLMGSEKKTVFILRKSGFMFIYSKKYHTVFGLSLSLCEYIGIDKEKVISRVLSNKKNRLVRDISNVETEYRAIIGYDNPHYILPLYEHFG